MSGEILDSVKYCERNTAENRTQNDLAEMRRKLPCLDNMSGEAFIEKERFKLRPK